MPQWLKVGLLSVALVVALATSFFAGWCTTNVEIVPKKPAPATANEPTLPAEWYLMPNGNYRGPMPPATKPTVSPMPHAD